MAMEDVSDGLLSLFEEGVSVDEQVQQEAIIGDNISVNISDTEVQPHPDLPSSEAGLDLLRNLGLASPAKRRRGPKRRSFQGGGGGGGGSGNSSGVGQNPSPRGSAGSASQSQQRQRFELARSKRWTQERTADGSGGSGPPAAATQSDSTDLTWFDKISNTLWTSDGMRGPASHLAERFGVSEYMVLSTTQRLVAAAMSLHDKLCDRFLQIMAGFCCKHKDKGPSESNAAGIEDFDLNVDIDMDDSKTAVSQEDAAATDTVNVLPQLFMRIRAYDETPIKLRVAATVPREPKSSIAKDLLPLLNLSAELDSEDHGDAHANRADTSDSRKDKETRPTELDTQMCKLLVTHQKFACLYVKKDLDGSVSSTLPIEAQQPTCLQVIESNTSELISAAIHQNITKPWDSRVNHCFKRILHVVVSDSFSGNFLAEKLLSEREAVEYPDATWTHHIDEKKLFASATDSLKDWSRIVGTWQLGATAIAASS